MNTKIKRWFFKTCPKSGRIVGINKKNVIFKVCFPLFGLAALIWFLIRVVPKPSRIEYPCQQIAAPIAFYFVAFISSTLVGFVRGNVSNSCGIPVGSIWGYPYWQSVYYYRVHYI